MDIFTDSDATMIATKSFSSIIDKVQSSGLNFSLQMSPFSALISVRKTLVRDKHGSYIIPPQIQNGTSDSCDDGLQYELNSLQMKHDELITANKSANETIRLLRLTIKERDDVIDSLSC